MLGDAMGASGRPLLMTNSYHYVCDVLPWLDVLLPLLVLTVLCNAQQRKLSPLCDYKPIQPIAVNTLNAIATQLNRMQTCH